MKNVWLDVDPGHDDAIALMLAIHCSNVNLIGVSTTHGNTSSVNTALNAARCLNAFGAPGDVRVYPGASKPLILPAKHDPEIHGEDGLGGVEGLPDADSFGISDRFAVVSGDGDGERVRAVEGMYEGIRSVWRKGRGERVTVVATGPMTNVALFVSCYEDMVGEGGAVEEIVFMGGGVGLGNRSAVAEYNVLTDPHATQIVLDSPVKVTMIPINVTHTAIATDEIQYRLLTNSTATTTARTSTENLELPTAKTPLRHTLNTLITFFASTYKSVFGFHTGPPLHDALAIAYVQNSDLFRGRRYRVDVELNMGGHCVGETVVDVWDYKRCGEDTWGREGKNCFVVQELDVPGFFDLFFECVARCDQVSPLNKK